MSKSQTQGVTFTESIMHSAEKESRRRADMETSIREGSGFSVMAGFGTNYITPFALLLRATAQQVGVLTSVPLLINAALQTLAIKLGEKVHSRLGLIIPLVLLQAFLWLPIMLAPLIFPGGPVPWIILFYSINSLVGALVNPAWTSLMGDLVHPSERGAYFSKRNKVTEFVMLVSTLIAGYVLGVFQGHGAALQGFLVILAIAVAGRLFSGYNYFKTREPEVERTASNIRGPSLSQFLVKEFFSSKSKFGTLTLYAALFSIAVEFSSTYMVVYMLQGLKYDYATYAFVAVAFNIALLLTYGYWGKLIDQYGNKLVLYASALMVPLVALGFSFFTVPLLLFCTEIVSGIAWAGQRLSSFNLVLEASPPEQRQTYVAYYNLFNGLGSFLGIMLGGLVIGYLMDSKLTFLVFSGFTLLFFISAVARLLVALIFIPKIHGIPFSDKIKDRHFLIKTITVYPLRSMMGELQYGVHRGLRYSIKSIKVMDEAKGHAFHRVVDAEQSAMKKISDGTKRGMTFVNHGLHRFRK